MRSRVSLWAFWKWDLETSAKGMPSYFAGIFPPSKFWPEKAQGSGSVISNNSDRSNTLTYKALTMYLVFFIN